MQELWESGDFIEAHKTEWGSITFYFNDSPSGLSAIVSKDVSEVSEEGEEQENSSEHEQHKYRIVGIPLQDLFVKNAIIRSCPVPTKKSDQQVIKFLYNYDYGDKIVLSDNIHDRNPNVYNFTQYWLTEYGTAHLRYGNIYEIDSSGKPGFLNLIRNGMSEISDLSDDEIIKIVLNSGAITQKDALDAIEESYPVGKNDSISFS